MSLSQEQKRVRLGMIAGTVFSAIFVFLCFRYLPFHSLTNMTMTDRLVFVLHNDIFALLSFLFGIMLVASERFFTPSAIGGENIAANKKISINVNYIQNTLEQFILFFISQLTLATILNAASLKIIPILVSLFLLGRICFWLGYHHNPVSRAFGFVATFYPTVAVIVYCVIYLIILM